MPAERLTIHGLWGLPLNRDKKHYIPENREVPVT